MKEKMNNVLALDTALSGCSAAVYNTKSGESVERSQSMPRGQAQYLVPMINEVLEEAGVGYDQLDAVITTVGPGAFTGLRIGMSTAKALTQALEIPLYGMSTLQVLACQYRLSGAQDYPLGVVIETKRQDFYVQFFDQDAMPLGEPMTLMADEIEALEESKEVFFIGDGCERLKNEKPHLSYGKAFGSLDVKIMAQTLIGQPNFVIIDNIEPIYLRDADVSEPKRQRKIQP